MFRCMVEIFGLPEEITGPPKIEVRLKDGANPSDVIAALRREVPVLEGPVIRRGEDQLTDSFGLYINGYYYIDDEEVQLKDGDRIVLLALASGG
ncbi:MAG: MoaD/ThiS family protein [Dehalococcoidales bacterium]|nr:MAG: MoaD/ThiS family protein [Dehalococcoidales bacterium]